MPATLSCDVSTPGQVTFTVSGTASAGAVYGVRLTGRCNGLAFTSLWAFTGDGTSSPVTLPPGAYVFAAVDSAGPSNPCHAQVDDGTDPVAFRCRAMVADFIRSMALPGLGDKVYERINPENTTGSFPCALVNLFDSQERDSGLGTEQRTQWEYPVRVIVGTNATYLDDAATAQLLKWRDTLVAAFDWLTPSSSFCQWTRSEPRAALQKFIYPTAAGTTFAITGSELVVKCHVRRFRGFP